MRKAYLTGVCLSLAIMGAPALPGMYTDDLARCLVEKTTKEDRTTLVRWIFSAISHNPNVADLSNVKPADMESSNKAVAALFTTLLTETCRDTSSKAIRFEGALAIQQSFQLLGEVAGREIFSHPDVIKVTQAMANYTDSKKIEALGKETPPAPTPN